MAWEQLLQTAARQAGVASVRLAEEHDVARSTYWHRAKREGWVRLHPGIHLVAGAPDSHLARCHATLQAAPQGSALTGLTGLRLAGIIGSTPTIHVVAPAPGPRPEIKGVRVTQSRSLRPEHCQTRAGLRVARPARSLADACTTLTDEQARGHVFALLQRRVASPAELVALGDALGPAPGSSRFRRAVRTAIADDVDSLLEAEVLAILRRRGLPRPVAGHPVMTRTRKLHLDLAWPEARLGLECDGWAFHRDPAALTRDAMRHNELATAGWTVLRVTWRMLDGDAERVVEAVRDAVAANPLS